jgi:NhaP-type Na+/H+ or K+/H+ antiporter
MSDKERAMSGVQNAVRIAITAFVLVLLTVLTLGLLWTGSHQPPPLRTASQVVLGIAALAGIVALARIWRRDPPATGSGRS